MAKTHVTNSETEVHTNGRLLDELKDDSSLVVQLAKQNILPTVYRPVSRRKRRARQRKQKQKHMLHKRMMRFTPKPSQEPSSVSVAGTITDSWHDIWSEEYKYSLKEVYDQEKIDTMDHKQQWEQQLLHDFEDFNELEQIVRLHDESERISEMEAIRVFAVQLEQEAYDQQFTQMENKENIFFCI